MTTVKTHAGKITAVDAAGNAITLDGDRTYKVAEAASWHVGDTVKVHFEDVGGERRATEVVKEAQAK